MAKTTITIEYKCYINSTSSLETYTVCQSDIIYIFFFFFAGNYDAKFVSAKPDENWLETVKTDRIRIYQPLVYFFGLVISSSSRSNDAVSEQSKRINGIRKRNLGVVCIILFDFVFI